MSVLGRVPRSGGVVHAPAFPSKRPLGLQPRPADVGPAVEISRGERRRLRRVVDNGECVAATRRALSMGGDAGRRLFDDPQSGDEFYVGLAARKAGGAVRSTFS